MSPSASRDEITRAYRKLVARYHPDKHQANELQDLAAEKLAAVNEAYQVLKDQRSRSEYDVRRGIGAGQPSPQGPTMRQAPDLARSLKSTLLFVVILSGGIFAMRFIRNPRAMAVVAVAIAAAWFGPRVYRLLKKK